MTVFNRHELTHRCLDSLYCAAAEAGASISVILTDASTNDATQALVRSYFPGVQYVPVDSATYWAEGMRTAWEEGVGETHEYLLWLNNDVELDSTSIVQLLAQSNEVGKQSILVGTCRDPETGNITYAGFNCGGRLKPLAFTFAVPRSHSPTPCDAPNGNVVFVPRELDTKLGGFPRGYRHNLADLAYGLEARRHGYQTYLTTTAVGTCSRNDIRGTWEDGDIATAERIRSVVSVKGFPPLIWAKFCLRYGGPLAFISFVRPYARALVPRRTN
ncbi:glycosyltransferase [Rhodococcus rhodochrous]|uniref:glycosyltransferase family 2 protein n=1 Tax=Rhodococcus rhodochrous TaxID=1829 RepID=UPI001321A829|nr:glycosyltransferase [Rhodococcus rhodochrous]